MDVIIKTEPPDDEYMQGKTSEVETTMKKLCIFEPAHEIMALFVLHKLILQTCMRSHPVEVDV